MKKMNIKVFSFSLCVIGLLLVSVTAMAQFGSTSMMMATAPTASFQSTSTMSGSGSAYSSNPSLNDDGTAAYNSASYAPARAISGPNRIAPVTPEGDPTPVGDEILPLLLMALVAGAVIVTKKRLIKL